jgi:hypothetical protein
MDPAFDFVPLTTPMPVSSALQPSSAISTSTVPPWQWRLVAFLPRTLLVQTETEPVNFNAFWEMFQLLMWIYKWQNFSLQYGITETVS